MPEGDDFVSGGRVRWGALVSLLFSSYLLAVWDGVIDVVETVGTIPSRLISALFSGYVELYSAILEDFAETVVTIFRSSAQSLPDLGPFTFPLAVGVIAVSVWLAINSVEWSLEVLDVD